MKTPGNSKDDTLETIDLDNLNQKLTKMVYDRAIESKTIQYNVQTKLMREMELDILITDAHWTKIILNIHKITLLTKLRYFHY